MNQPIALVTGAGSGIGRATAQSLCESGFAVAIVGRRAEALDQTASLCSGPVLSIPADLTNPATAHRMIEQTTARFGRLDALVNNAGAAPLLPIEKHTPDILNDIFRINALAPACAIAAAWPVFVKQRSGCIVNISTMGTLDPFAGFFGYAAAKASVNVMARSCASEGRRHNIRAFAIAPGAVDTEMLQANFPSIPAERRLTPDAIARIILDCIQGRRDAQNGQTIAVPSP